jgi:hypothetical protein
LLNGAVLSALAADFKGKTTSSRPKAPGGIHIEFAKHRASRENSQLHSRDNAVVLAVSSRFILFPVGSNDDTVCDRIGRDNGIEPDPGAADAELDSTYGF